ncbi:AAA family ATPase [Fictibacillus nanhaiensis]|uniref:AAA family ATPase n=1 Tax=Fictibacillus nanhaiensis TaxID=742169 RepID=UPI002E1C1931|nr:AAA family ATPase [Fictibacillus nanhaiensis]MED1865346.1 AAA family ATPase [Fictibacillus nanhaiensis]
MFLKRIKLLREEIKSIKVYPFSIPAISKLDEIHLKKNVTFFVGENGTGKSTLLEAIADKCDFNTAGGGRNNMYDVYASESELGNYIRLSWMPKVSNGFFLRAESFYSFATHLEDVDDTGFRDYGGRSLHKQSHGESFLSLFLHRFKGKAIYLLDEPEAALSPSRQLTFLKIIHDLTAQGDTQFIIATHSPILLGYPNADIINFDDGKILKVDYESTDHFQVTKYFLNNREKFLSELLKDD